MPITVSSSLLSIHAHTVPAQTDAIRVQEAPNIIRDPNSDARLFSSNNVFIQKCHAIASSIVCGRCKNNEWTKI